MGIVLSISLTTIYLLEYVLPFAKDTKGIEFSTNAYYQSISAVEEGLYIVANNELGYTPPDDPLNSWNHNDFWYEVEARWNTIPPLWEWNSLDPDWNTLSPWKPVQIEIWSDVWNNAEIRLRVPDTWVWTNIPLRTQTGGIITWQISSTNTTLIANDEADRIGTNLLKSWINKKLDIRSHNGKNLEWNIETFQNFYGSECNNTNETCTLKLSIINELVLNNNHGTPIPIPYIEYRIEGLNNAPLRYTRINTQGYSYGFKKEIDIKIPQQTVNEAFDFTIFQ